MFLAIVTLPWATWTLTLSIRFSNGLENFCGVTLLSASASWVCDGKGCLADRTKVPSALSHSRKACLSPGFLSFASAQEFRLTMSRQIICFITSIAPPAILTIRASI